MGTMIRVFVGSPSGAGDIDPGIAAILAEAQLLDFGRRLSRFEADSELSLLNRDPREEVPASTLLRRAVLAGLWGAERTGGLVDPTLVDELEEVGYTSSLDGQAPASLAEALAAAPQRRPARPDPESKWRSIEVLDEQGAIRRPPGLRFDTGGIGKGLAADIAASKLAGYARYVVDVGGDVRVGGREPDGEPIEIEVRHPQTGKAADSFAMGRGAVATSGLDARLWVSHDGRFSHHLIDPSTGRPAWTGLICASARAPTALEADVLAKAALLTGEAGARVILARHGGVIISEDGEVERVAPVGEASTTDP